MLKSLLVAAVALPLAALPALAGSGSCNWSSKENTVAQSPVPAPVAAAQTPAPQPAEPAKVDVAQAPVTTPAQPKTN